jgi:hypothetical protein
MSCEVRDRLDRNYLLAAEAFNEVAKKIPLADPDAWRTEMETAISARADALAALTQHRSEHKC